MKVQYQINWSCWNSEAVEWEGPSDPDNLKIGQRLMLWLAQVAFDHDFSHGLVTYSPSIAFLMEDLNISYLAELPLHPYVSWFWQWDSWY